MRHGLTRLFAERRDWRARSGFWAAPGKRGDARSLAGTLRWMADAGWFCFMQGRTGLLPVSPPCWRDKLEVRRWSNLACAHDTAVVAALLKLVPQ